MSSRYQTTNNNFPDFTMAKPCKNECKTMIIWSHALKAYTDLGTGLKHKCLNYNPFTKQVIRNNKPLPENYYQTEDQIAVQRHNLNWRNWMK